MSQRHHLVLEFAAAAAARAAAGKANPTALKTNSLPHPPAADVVGLAVVEPELAVGTAAVGFEWYHHQQ